MCFMLSLICAILMAVVCAQFVVRAAFFDGHQGKSALGPRILHVVVLTCTNDSFVS